MNCGVVRGRGVTDREKNNKVYPGIKTTRNKIIVEKPLLCACSLFQTPPC
jgi:hypothetical protein